jgi:ribosomal protein L29
VSKLSERRQQIREYNLGEAEQELERLRRQLFDLRIQQQRGEVKNNRQFTQVRTDIARLMYQVDVLNQAALEAESAEEDEVVEGEEAAEPAEEEAPAEAEEQEAAAEVEAEEATTEARAEEAEAKEAAVPAPPAEEPPGKAKRGRKPKAKEEAGS